MLMSNYRSHDLYIYSLETLYREDTIDIKVRFPVKSNNSHYSMPYVEYNKTESSIDAIYCCPVAFTLFRWNDSYMLVMSMIDVIYLL